MQCEIRGDWVYILSGRLIYDKRPESEPHDPFETVHVIHKSRITGIRVNHRDFTVDIFVEGHTCHIHCSFGYRNCHKINTHGMFVQKLVELLGLDTSLIWCDNVRDPEVSNAMTREDYALEGQVD